MTAAVLLLAVAGTLLQSLNVALGRDPGFEPTLVTTMRIEPPAAAYPRPSLPQLVDVILQEIDRLPGVAQVAATTRIPLGRSETWRGYKPAGAPDPGFDDGFFATWLSITPGYLDTIGISIAHGRDFLETDNSSGAPVVIINETLARRAFGRADVVGEQVHIWTDEEQPRTVVGVVANARNRSLFGAEIPAEYYAPFAQAPFSRISLVVRQATDSAEVVPLLRGALLEVDAQLPIFDVRTMETVIAEDTASRRTSSRFLGILAAVALALAIFGLYGVVTYATSSRTHELGVRIALGANRGSIQALVVRQGMLLGGLGTILGLAVAQVATRALSTFAPEIAPEGSTWTIGLVITVTVLATTGLATYMPARRAGRTDPLSSLRES
ncbi:MAG: FtsX-like permease family protein [Acidobacteria bacterium]|nr:FtsX-like permease family protein [Acidobacteriota bacterium]